MKTRTYLLIMLAAIAVPLACLSFAGLYWLLETERAARLRSIEETANSTMLKVDSELSAAAAALRVVAHSRGIAQDDFARLHSLLSATRQSPLSWTLIADYEGNGLLNTLVPFGTPLATGTGPWAARIYDSQEVRVSGYFVGNKSGKGVVSVNVPVPRSAGKKYVVTQIFDPGYFNTVFASTGQHPGWIIGLFDAKGISVARNVHAEGFVGKPVRPALFAASRSAPRGVVRNITREGAEVYTVFVRSPMSNWTVAIGVPVEEIEVAARMTTFYAALALLAVLGSATGIAVYFGRRIDKSIQDATVAAQALASGSIAPAAHSRLKEVDALLAVLHGSGLALAQESQARAVLEHEREDLLERERSARRQAESQNTAKDHFISMLSHELRNPLAAIASAVAVMRLPAVSPVQADKAWAIVQRQLKHMTRMLEELLDVRRILSGKVILQLQALNVGELLQACYDAKSVGDAHTHAWAIDAHDAWVLGDRTRLGQVIDNLLSNAVKFTPAGGAISLRSRVEGARAIIEVEDSGAGIAADILPTIFDSLVQGPTTIDRSQGGLGLGLSIAQGLAAMHGGSISAASEGPGRGSTFRVELPLHDPSGAAAPHGAAAAPRAAV